MCVQVDSSLVGSSSAGVVIGAGGSASLRGNRIELNELDGVLVRGPAYGDDAGELAVFQDNFVAGNGQAALALEATCLTSADACQRNYVLNNRSGTIVLRTGTNTRAEENRSGTAMISSGFEQAPTSHKKAFQQRVAAALSLVVEELR
eukprot:COSAG01_NODE_3008_length_6730_cov_6.438245_5_plen_148_part_00